MVSRRIHDYDDPGPKSHFEAALVVVCVCSSLELSDWLVKAMT